MKVFLASSAVFWDSSRNRLFAGAEEAVRELKAQGDSLILVSSTGEPHWRQTHFPRLAFRECSRESRMKGTLVQEILNDGAANGLKLSDVVVLGAKDADLLTAVQGKVPLVRCEWAPLEQRVSKYGLRVRAFSELPELANLLRCGAPWAFRYESDFLHVYVLTNANTLRETDEDILRLKEKLRACLKDGELEYREQFAAHYLSSICATDIFREVDIWCWYPGHTPWNSDNEVMRHFSDLARTTFGKTTRGPLFLRHSEAPKRSRDRSVDREDPRSQVTTLYLNPKYQGRIEGKTIALVDDYTTYGLSFGVAARMLHLAGAKKVICVAMGKFGNHAKLYKWFCHPSDLFKPIKTFQNKGSTIMPGKHNLKAQVEFVEKFRSVVVR